MTPSSLLSQEIRALYSLTQTELAARLSVSPSLISKIERGHRRIGAYVVSGLIREFPNFDWSRYGSREDDENGPGS